MEIASIIQLLFIITGFLFVIGLIRPGFVVFWSDNKSRGAVVASFGLATLVLGITYFAITSRKNDPFKQGSIAQPTFVSCLA